MLPKSIPIPINIKEVVNKLSHDKIGFIVKTEVDDYIRSYLDPNGLNSVITEKVSTTAPNYVLTAETDKKGDTDSNKKQILLAMTSEQLKEVLPAILISDEMPKWMPQSLSKAEDIRVVNGVATHRIPIRCLVPVKIQVVAHDEASAKELGTFMSFIFGPLQNFGNGNYIKQDKKNHWSITFPMIHDAPTIEKVPNANDDLQSIWVATLMADFQYETTVFLDKKVKFSATAEGFADATLNKLIPIIYELPSTMSVGQSATAKIDKLTVGYKVVIVPDSPLAITYEVLSITQYKITALRPCKYKLKIVNESNEMVLEKEVIVTY